MGAPNDGRLVDVVVPFQIGAGIARGRFVRLGNTFDDVIAGKDYPPVVAGMLGECLALATVLASGLKYEGAFTLQTKSDGPINMLVADLTSDGDLRGYVRYDKEKIDAVAEGQSAVVPRILGAGYLAFTVDQGPDTERYQGMTPLDGGTLSECAHAYFRQSEQLDTVIVLMSKHNAGRGNVAAGLMVQRMPSGAGDPEENEEAWRRAVAFASSVTAAEMLDSELDADRLLYRLYHEDGVRVFEDRPIRCRCRCSSDRVEALLRSFDSEQIQDMMDDGRIHVTCEFCGAVYEFDEQTLRTLDDSGNST